jgi:hypothetical protein
MRGVGHVEEKPIAAPAGPIVQLAPGLPTKCPAGMPVAYSIFRKICHVVTDSETWPNAAAVARFPRNASVFGQFDDEMVFEHDTLHSEISDGK